MRAVHERDHWRNGLRIPRTMSHLVGIARRAVTSLLNMALSAVRVLASVGLGCILPVNAHARMSSVIRGRRF